MRVFSYKLVRDYGFAPNPYHGYCTLATCKPQIRAAADIGDIIVGCGSAALNNPNRIIFAMRVAEKLSFQNYWNDPRFSQKKPTFYASVSRAYGDNIYHREGGQWIQEDSHHSLPGGAVNVSNLNRDTNADSVLIGTDFVYWGRVATSVPPELQAAVSGEDLYPSSRSHRSIFSDGFVLAVNKWFSDIHPRGIQGRPTSW